MNWQKIYREIQPNFKYMIYMLIFNLTSIASAFQGSITVRSIGIAVRNLGEAWFCVFLTVGILSMIGSRYLQKIVLQILVVLSGLIFILETFCIYQYGALPDAALLQVLIATNYSEALGYFKMYILQWKILVGLIFIIVAMYAVHKLLSKISSRQVVCYHYFLIVLIPICIVLINIGMHSKDSIFDSIGFTKYYSLGRLVFESNTAIDSLKEYKTVMERNNIEDIEIIENNDDIPYVVFILGESTSRNHMSLYGYGLPTTPALEERQRDGELYVFKDVISPHSHTMPVMEKLFSFYRYGMTGHWYEYHNLFDVLHKAGIHTAWISNQESSGIFGNTGRVYAEKCDFSSFTHLRDSTSIVKPDYDEAVLPLIDQAVDTAEKNNFFTVHLMGTHGPYEDRYPTKWKVFNLDDETGKKDKEKEVRASYDNAIRYNDYIVNEIIKKFENKNAIVIYVSDHGEEVYDDRDVAGHDEMNGSHWMIEIPLIVWTSNQFKEKHLELCRNMENLKGKSYMTDDMIHSLMDLMKIHTTEYDCTKSIFNIHFNDGRKRIYAGKEYRL